MFKFKIIIPNFLCLTVLITAYTQDCNKLGAWLWYIDITGFNSHDALADSLSALGVKRIYVKVADGKVDNVLWPELADKALVNTYKSKGMEVWAWSYNYPGNESLQAIALYQAAATGYQGYVIDVETEFDNRPQEAEKIFKAFYTSRDSAISANLITADFKIYCTTWGNPEDHQFPISAIDPYVDAYMPQTYVENWGGNYISNLVYWIQYGNEEYRKLGATKPLHHIVSTEKDMISAVRVNEFFQTSGPESSVWVIPGDNTKLSIWNTWRQINWKMNFCTNSTKGHAGPDDEITLYPNPVFDKLIIKHNSEVLMVNVVHSTGMLIRTFKENDIQEEIEFELPLAGIYYVYIQMKNGKSFHKMVIKI